MSRVPSILRLAPKLVPLLAVPIALLSCDTDSSTTGPAGESERNARFPTSSAEVTTLALPNNGDSAGFRLTADVTISDRHPTPPTASNLDYGALPADALRDLATTIRFGAAGSARSDVALEHPDLR
jgi:hypothetical protein